MDSDSESDFWALPCFPVDSARRKVAWAEERLNTAKQMLADADKTIAKFVCTSPAFAGSYKRYYEALIVSATNQKEEAEIDLGLETYRQRQLLN